MVYYQEKFMHKIRILSLLISKDKAITFQDAKVNEGDGEKFNLFGVYENVPYYYNI